MEEETITAILRWEVNFILTVNQLNVIMDVINLTNITPAIILLPQSITECLSELKLASNYWRLQHVSTGQKLPK